MHGGFFRGGYRRNGAMMTMTMVMLVIVVLIIATRKNERESRGDAVNSNLIHIRLIALALRSGRVEKRFIRLTRANRLIRESGES